MNFEKVEKYRIKRGFFASKEGDCFGAFFIKYPNKLKQTPFKVICAPSTDEWQHVSVSLPNRCPTWEEMCFIKNLFWDEDECIVQFHPPKKEYINNAKFCLHLWKLNNGQFPRPQKHLVGL